MTPFVWRDRLVKLQENAVMLSAKGRHDDWDFFPAEYEPRTQAVALSVDGSIYNIEPMPDGRLGVHSTAGRFILSGDDFSRCTITREP